MSDFIFSSTKRNEGDLAYQIESIYYSDKPSITEFHGAWGSLAVSYNLYNGFQPLENDSHIFVVIGGPMLCFQEKHSFINDDNQAGSKLIYERWLKGNIQWDDDLSGPFVVLFIDKQNYEINCITDLMMFIPVYKYHKKNILMLGTHIDVLAQVSEQHKNLDDASIADFILHDVVTYPYTYYYEIRQCHPAADHNYFFNIKSISIDTKKTIYWQPVEECKFNDINEAAYVLRQDLERYVKYVTDGMTHVAQFISGGEDSRSLSGLLPKDLKRDAFVFIDSMNREGRIAKKVSSAYKLNFFPEYRSKTHYLEILPEATDLIGNGQQYIHAHTLGFHKKCGLNEYDAVFGGYLADSLLKACYAPSIGGYSRFPFIPQFFLSSETRSQKINNALFTPEILNVVTQRRQKHLRAVKKFRKKTSHEWFVLWPATMRAGLPNFYCNRRLFCSYEIFMTKQVVKVSASVPISWKLNRRLFNKVVRSYLIPSKWILHPDGRLPYFPWWFNAPVKFFVSLSRYIIKKIGVVEEHQGPWGDWIYISKSNKWKEAINENKEGFNIIGDIFVEHDLNDIFENNRLNDDQKINLLQVLYSLTRKNEKLT